MAQGGDRAVRVLIVDPMPLARKALAEALRPCGGVVIVGAASGPSGTARRIADGAIDVLLLDIERPVEAAVEQLRGLWDNSPFRVVLFTALDGTDLRTVMDAFAVPASAVVAKPASSLLSGTHALRMPLEAALLAAGLRSLPPARPSLAHASAVQSAMDRVVAIGASTGGTEALVTVMSGLPRRTPGLVIVQHMPPGFTASFARRLDGIGALDVKEAQDGDAVLPGRALLAPGAHHLTVEPGAHGLVVRVAQGAQVNGHCPSVDVLMASVARYAGRHALGVLLTGMGSDGALGMKAIRDAGGTTIGQDKATSVVYGMPRVAFETGGVGQVVPLPEIAGRISAGPWGHA